jgi:hypothetical protein
MSPAEYKTTRALKSAGFLCLKIILAIRRKWSIIPPVNRFALCEGVIRPQANPLRPTFSHKVGLFACRFRATNSILKKSVTWRRCFIGARWTAESAVQKSQVKAWAALNSFDPSLLRQPNGESLTT